MTAPDATAPGRGTRLPAPAAPVGLLVAVLLVAANLRATLTGVGTLLPDIERGSGLSSTWGGLLNTLPLLTFAATSPLVARASHRYGTAKLLAGSLAVLACGTVIRSLPSDIALFAGTAVLSAAIACGNVLLPAVIRRHVPGPRIHTVSALYVTVMGLVAAVSSGISVPVAHALPGGWHTGLAWGIVFAVAALPVWLLRTRGDTPAASTGAAPAPTPWRSALAWKVSFFMGLQSFGFYTIIAWLPSILARQGMSSTAAGWMLFYYQVVALTAGLVVPLATRGRPDQRFTAAGASLLVAAGFLLLLVPAVTVVACTLLGLGGGACLVLALGFQSQRAGGPGQAAALAGMAQSIGYLVAATGPLLLGALHDGTGGWTVPLVLLAAVSLAMAAAGHGAGRDRRVPAPEAAPESGTR
ncbi:MFS transporter [Streptomyces tremellae]|uniref:CynX/NimT family MFS transporter n=1 Tax=Streptomyces tremellae TaxID=1124239 RepID=UPI0031ED5690